MYGKYILGLMSGSSLDGLDVALIHFPSDFYEEKKWSLIERETISYSNDWVSKLKKAVDHEDHLPIHLSFGEYLGQLLNDYLANIETKPDLIAVHGHTLFHHPEKAISVQLGAAQSIADITGIPAMDDFRIQDILLGGQGAPLAPTAEHWLYKDHQVFLNIGGILNLSYHTTDNITAFDIGPGNQLLNALAQEAGFPYDAGGIIAQQGEVIQSLLSKAKENKFYQKSFPKSLSNQWVQKEVIPLFQHKNDSLPDRMATAIALITWTLETAIDQINLDQRSILVSGGGAYNSELIKKMQIAIRKKNNTIVIPDDDTINYKEASLMALMGFLNITGSNNVFGESTGSKINHCAGNLCVPKAFPLV